jgi:hypothetical protein
MFGGTRSFLWEVRDVRRSCRDRQVHCRVALGALWEHNPRPPGATACSEGHGQGGDSAGRGQLSLISRGHHPPAQTEVVEDESHCHAVHGSSGPRYCGGGAPAPRHARARQLGARGHGRPDGSPAADGPIPVLAESLVHGGRTTVAARATPLVVPPAVPMQKAGLAYSAHLAAAGPRRVRLDMPAAQRASRPPVPSCPEGRPWSGWGGHAAQACGGKVPILFVTLDGVSARNGAQTTPRPRGIRRPPHLPRSLPTLADREAPPGDVCGTCNGQREVARLPTPEVYTVTAGGPAHEDVPPAEADAPILLAYPVVLSRA